MKKKLYKYKNQSIKSIYIKIINIKDESGVKETEKLVVKETQVNKCRVHIKTTELHKLKIIYLNFVQCNTTSKPVIFFYRKL